MAAMLPMVPMDPEMPAITQANTSTTQVRMAVAISESVCLMPHLARIDVMPAKNADANAAATHDMGEMPPQERLRQIYSARPMIPFRHEALISPRRDGDHISRCHLVKARIEDEWFSREVNE